VIISMVVTVLNEGQTIARLLDSIAGQTRLPDEVVACDGGSADDTVARLNAERRFPVRVLESPGANISRGRNIAIDASMGDLIVCADAGVRLDPGWVEALAAAAEKAGIGPGDRRLIGGVFAPEYTNAFELAMSATVLPLPEEIRPERFLPSSRSVAFTRAGWEAAGRYPEWLDFCEDLVFDLRALRAGPFVFAAGAIVHFRPRSTLRAFWRQYYQYARGDGKAGLWPKRHAIRYATYLLALPGLLIGALAAPDYGLQTLCVAGLAIGAGAYLRAPYRRLVRLWGTSGLLDRLRAVALAPVIRVVGDLAKMAGYPVGAAWRRKRIADQPELRWREIGA
jgi:glycosyltransferase involved in cell wall biosynthesis